MKKKLHNLDLEKNTTRRHYKDEDDKVIILFKVKNITREKLTGEAPLFNNAAIKADKFNSTRKTFCDDGSMTNPFTDRKSHSAGSTLEKEGEGKDAQLFLIVWEDSGLLQGSNAQELGVRNESKKKKNEVKQKPQQPRNQCINTHTQVYVWKPLFSFNCARDQI